MCEYRIVRNAIYKKSLRFNMKCCQYIQKVSTGDFIFINGLHCIEDKKCKFFYENLLYKKFKPPCHQALFKPLRDEIHDFKNFNEPFMKFHDIFMTGS